MTASRNQSEPTTLVSPVIDYEPPPLGITPALNVAGQAAPLARPRSGDCRRGAAMSPARGSRDCRARRSCPPRTRVRRSIAPCRPASHAAVREAAPPRAAVVFADSALRRVLEVIDRRRPTAQLRPLLAPALIDPVIAMTRSSHDATATLRRLRVRTVDGDHETQAEVFGTFTRGQRVRAIAARIELNGDRWRIVALQMG